MGRFTRRTSRAFLAAGRRRSVRSTSTPVVAVVVALTLAGCGAASVPHGANGRTVFATSCSGCHSLAGNESLHRQGGDLLGFRMSRGVLVQFVREMPVPRPLSAAQLAAVVDYVYG